MFENVRANYHRLIAYNEDTLQSCIRISFTLKHTGGTQAARVTSYQLTIVQYRKHVT